MFKFSAWWRCGESNPSPEVNYPKRIHAQFVDYTLCVAQQTKPTHKEEEQIFRQPPSSKRLSYLPFTLYLRRQKTLVGRGAQNYLIKQQLLLLLGCNFRYLLRLFLMSRFSACSGTRAAQGFLPLSKPGHPHKAFLEDFVGLAKGIISNKT